MAVSGSIKNISVGGRGFEPTADADFNTDLGGYMNDVVSNGGGGARILKTAKPWKLDNGQVSIDQGQGDQEFLQEIADSNLEVPIVITYVSGAIYNGVGTIIGDLAFSNMNSTASLNLSGKGKLTPQS